MRRAHRTEAAERDLQEIAFRIAFEDGRPNSSDRLIDELVDQCDQLAALAKASTLGTAALRHARKSIAAVFVIDACNSIPS